jgi:hypothetical protein
MYKFTPVALYTKAKQAYKMHPMYYNLLATKKVVYALFFAAVGNPAAASVVRPRQSN